MVTSLVVYGLPGNGKTYAAGFLSKNLNTKLIPFDGVINVISEYVRKKNGGKNSPIEFTGSSYPGIFQNSEDFNGFRDDLDQLISENDKFFKNFYKKFIENKSTLVNYESGFSERAIDLGRNGDALEPFAEKILNIVFKYIVKKESFFIIEGYYFNEDKNFREKIKKLCEKVIYLGCFYKQKNKTYPYLYQGKEFTNLTKVEEQLQKDLNAGQKSYQSFSSERNTNSKSTLKLKKLGIPSDLNGKTVLDLGCNEGFFSFECEKRGAKVIGIELDKNWFQKALKRKNEISSFVNFLNEDWNSLPTLNYKFDIVLFLAAFHYIKNNQLQILRNVFDKMKKNGLFILEAGVIEKNEGAFLIESIKRPAGDVCQFTNKFTLEKLLKDSGFNNIRFYGKSVQVVGDDIPRYVVHATKGDKSTQDSYRDAHQPVESYEKLSKEGAKTKDISLYDVENLLISLYNKNSFYRKLFHLMYKIFKKNSKN